MPKLRSIEDLQRLRGDLEKKASSSHTAGLIDIRIRMGSTAIATGALETYKEFEKIIAERKLNHVRLKQVGSRGQDSFEPVVLVIVADQPAVAYGKVDPQKARRIMSEHIQKGMIIQDFRITP